MRLRIFANGDIDPAAILDGRKKLWSYVFTSAERKRHRKEYGEDTHTMLSSLDLEDVATVSKVEGSGLEVQVETSADKLGQAEESDSDDDLGGVKLEDEEWAEPEPVPMTEG